MPAAEASLHSDTEVLIRRTFAAPVARVWRAYEEPDLMRRWCAGPPGWSMPVCDMEMRVGGQYRWRWRDAQNGHEFGFAGEFLEISPHAKISHTQNYDPGELGISMGNAPYVVTVLFQEAEGITNVTTTIRFTSKADRDEAFATGMTDGMEQSYQRLDAVLAEG